MTYFTIIEVKNFKIYTVDIKEIYAMAFCV